MEILRNGEAGRNLDLESGEGGRGSEILGFRRELEGGFAFGIWGSISFDFTS
jgi:hypothetical protein